MGMDNAWIWDYIGEIADAIHERDGRIERNIFVNGAIKNPNVKNVTRLLKEANDRLRLR